MRINQNISAMNTYSRLTGANNAKAGNLERLSSGLRINRAGDDAAGLSISEKMRGQVKGLNQAVRNAQDGISLIQTAEGALNETHSILNRMRELAVQSANDTNTDADRNEIQKEIDQLSQEMTRIGNTTQFNTMNLLDGDFAGKKFHIGANEDQTAEVAIGDMRAKSLGVEGNAFKATLGSGATELEVFSRTSGTQVLVAGGSGAADFGVSVSGTTITVTAARNASGTITSTLADIKQALEAQGLTVNLGADANATGTAEAVSGTVAALGSGDTNPFGINVSTQANANTAIKSIDDAIANVSAERSKLGATQNRLEHTINNLTATSENLSAAESRIRDVDMAAEMMEFTKNNILSQAATSMLAQANQMPQSVLQLLQ